MLWYSGAFGGRQLLVEVDQRLGLRMVDRQAVTHGLFLVVLALDQLFAGNVVLAGDLRRVVLGVVHAAGGRMHATTGDTRHDLLVVDGDLDHMVDGHAGVLQRFGLRDGPREAVEQEALGAIGLGDAFLDQGDDDVVGYQAAAVHHAFHLLAERAAGLDCGAQHVAGGDLRNAELLGDEPCLGAFAGTGCPEQNHTHRYAP